MVHSAVRMWRAMWRSTWRAMVLVMGVCACSGAGEPAATASDEAAQPTPQAAAPEAEDEAEGEAAPQAQEGAPQDVAAEPPAAAPQAEDAKPEGAEQGVAVAAAAEDERAERAVPSAKGSDTRAAKPAEKVVAAQPEPTPAEAPEAPEAKAAAQACGDDDQPPCPLQGWMDKHLQTPFDAGDAKQVAAGLRKAARMAPEAGWNAGDKGWATIANAGADQADAGDMVAVKQSCKACHKAWRKKYKATYRQRPVP